MKYFFPSIMSDQKNRDSSEESESREDSDGNGLSHETESDDVGAENKLHVKIIRLLVKSIQ